MTGVSGYKEGVKKIGAGDTIFFRELDLEDKTG